MRRRSFRAWWKQFRWARARRNEEAREFCTYRSFNRWAKMKELNDISNVWRKK